MSARALGVYVCMLECVLACAYMSVFASMFVYACMSKCVFFISANVVECVLYFHVYVCVSART